MEFQPHVKDDIMNFIIPNISNFTDSEKLCSSFPQAITEITYDFRYVKFMPISYMVFLAGYSHGIARLGGNVKINLDSIQPSLLRYMQRMDFFKVAGLDLVEDFVRHEAQNRFMPIKKIGVNGEIRTERIATSIADCIVPEEAHETDPDKTNTYDCVEYSVSELMNNVIQHSSASGYISAQYYRRTDHIVVAVSDGGIGIRESFEESGSPISASMHDDLSALQKALEPTVSSKTHSAMSWGGTENAGVGLTLLGDIARQSGGYFLVCSGDAYANNQGTRNLSRGRYQGTFGVFAFRKSKMKSSFSKYLDKSKTNAGLISPEDEFDDIFG